MYNILNANFQENELKRVLLWVGAVSKEFERLNRDPGSSHELLLNLI